MFVCSVLGFVNVTGRVEVVARANSISVRGIWWDMADIRRGQE